MALRSGPAEGRGERGCCDVLPPGVAQSKQEMGLQWGIMGVVVLPTVAVEIHPTLRQKSCSPGIVLRYVHLAFGTSFSFILMTVR